MQPHARISTLRRAALAIMVVCIGACSSVSSWRNRAAVALSPSILQTRNVSFVPHIGDGVYQRYLAVNLDYAPVAQLRREVERQFGVRLKDRGEAHITVLTPPEYEAIAHYVDIQEITAQFGEAIQAAPFEPVCIGRGEAKLSGRLEQSWFLLIASQQLRDVRQRLHRLIVASGGPVSSFDPQAWYPHATLGFSLRDLFIQDGVVKDPDTCVAPVRLLQ